MEVKEALDICVEIISQGKILNSDFGVIGVDINGPYGNPYKVHLTEDTPLFYAIPGDFVEKRRQCDTYPWEYTKTYKGVPFFYVTDKRRA